MVARESGMAVDHTAQIARHQHDVGASIATSVPVPMARPTSACGQGGCVVDAVADECRPGVLRLAGGGSRRLYRRAGPRRGPRRCRAWRAIAAAVAGVVAGDHRHLQGPCAQRCDRCRGRRLDRVGDGEHPGEAGRRRRRGSGFCPPAASRRAISPNSAGSTPTFGQQRCGADEHACGRRRRPDALAGDRGEVLGGGHAEAAVAGCGDDRAPRWDARSAPRRQPPSAARLILVQAPTASTSVRSGCPRSACRSCRSTTVSSLVQRSAGPRRRRNRMPSSAPRPVPTMMDGRGRQAHARRAGDDQHRDGVAPARWSAPGPDRREPGSEGRRRRSPSRPARTSR